MLCGMDIPFRRRRATKEQEGAVAALSSIFRPKTIFQGVHYREAGDEDYVLLIREEEEPLGFFLRRDGRLEELSSDQLAEALPRGYSGRPWDLPTTSPARPTTAP